MTKNYSLFLKLLLLLPFVVHSQTKEPTNLNDSGFQFSLRGGYDFPVYCNNTPFVDYKGGLDLGISVDYYWRWFGIGADADYIRNKPKSIYPKEHLVFETNTVIGFDGYEDGITRIFYGIGPSFKYQKSNKFSAELKLRGGMASVKGGRTYLEGLQSASAVGLNFHAGYDKANVLSAKGALQFNYFFNDAFGLHVGGYYLEHFKVEEMAVTNYNISAMYRSVTPGSNGTQPINSVESNQELRTEPCNCEAHSIGVFAGITYRIPENKIKKELKAPKPIPVYTLIVTAKDKYTNQPLPETQITVSNAKGEVLRKATTDINGEIKVDSIHPGDYAIDGELYRVALEGTKSIGNEFLPNQILRKVILYTDANFILKGKVVDAETRNVIPEVTVAANGKQDFLTDADGKFMMPMSPEADLPLYLQKKDYFSKTETIAKPERKEKLFLETEIALEKFDCGKAIKLENIHYDLDKYFIREESKPELNKLVQFLNDNPEVRVELSSHTDCRASSRYNDILSQNRANAAVDYIVSQGIAKSRLVGKGYGERKLLNKCADKVKCTEEEHQLNRRTEMKVICK